MATLEPGSAAHSPTPDSSGRASPIPRQWRNQLSSGDHPSKADKAFRRYAVVVDKALALFETSLDEWADYISFLNRLLKALQARTANMNAVPSRTMVAKRLAQCLNPQLPSGVHQKALEVYGYIFDMIGPEGLFRDLPLYLPGLATTLSFASLSVREPYLDLLERYFLNLSSTALRPAMKSIILGLLPGLEDESSEDFERTLKLIGRFKAAIRPPSAQDIVPGHSTGDDFFWQVFFLASITGQSRRPGALAYMVRNLPRLGHPLAALPGSNGASIKHIAVSEKDSEVIAKLPELAAMVTSPEPGLLLRSFAAGLQDDQMLIQRGFLDMLVTHLPLHSSILQSVKPGDLELLLRAAVGVVIRRDMSLNRRLWAWFLGPDPTSEAEPEAEVDGAGSDSPPQSASDPRSFAAKTAYFQTYGLSHLISALLGMINNPSQELTATERARPFRICLSLMDRWEIGGLIDRDVFLPIIDSVRKFKNTAKTRAEFLEVLRSASVFFDGAETGLIFKSLHDLVVQTITDDKKLRTDDERLGDIRLAAFILANFNVREEEMITLHAPMLAASILCRAKAIKYGRFNTSIGWTVVKEALGVVLTLLELAPARAFVSIEDEKAVKVADSDAIVSKAIGDWYEEHHGNIEETEPPYSAAKIETILFNQACAAFSASLQSPQHATIVVQSYDILAQLLSKVPMNQHTTAPLHDVISAIRMGLLKYPTIPFPTFAAMLATATQIFTVGQITAHELSTHVPALVKHAWSYLAAGDPKYHVEVVRALWLLQSSLSANNHDIEAALCSLIVQDDQNGSFAARSSDSGRTFSVLWSHTLQDHAPEKRGSKASTGIGLVDLNKMVTSEPRLAGADAFHVMLTQPLMLMLDALLDERTQLYMTVKMWLNTTIGLDRLLFVFILKFSELPFLSKNGPVLTDFGFQDPAISEEDDVDMCLYLIRTLSNVLDVAPDLLWSLMASNNVSDQHFYNRISKITGKEEVAMQEFFVHVCMHCIARNYVPKDSNLKERESQLCRSALALLTQLLGSSYADSLAQLNLQDALISRLHQSLAGPEPYVQVLLLEVVLVSLKLSVKADPPAPETIPEDKWSLNPDAAAKRPPIPMSASTTSLATSAPSLKIPVTPTKPAPPPALLKCLQAGLVSQSTRPVLDSWITFLSACLPLYEDSIFQVLIPLVETFCTQISENFQSLQALFGRGLVKVPAISNGPELTLVALINGLEDILITAHVQLLIEEKQAVTTKSPDQPQGFFGNMVSGVFATDAQQARSATANDRLTVYLAFQDAVRVCFCIWSWGQGSDAAALDQSSSASFAYTSLRIRNRARRLLERLFTVETLECLETVIEIWRKAYGIGSIVSGSEGSSFWDRHQKGIHSGAGVIKLFPALDGSRPKNTMPALFDAIYSRTNPSALEPSHKSTLTISLQDADLAIFLNEYARSLEDDAMDEIWTDCMTFLKDILANPFPHRQILPLLLDFAATLGAKVEKTNFGELRKMRRELGDIFLRLLTAIFTTRPLTYSEPNPPVPSEKASAVALTPSEKADDVIGILADIVPNLAKILVENDRVLSAATTISTNVLQPLLKSKYFPESVSPSTVRLFSELARVPQNQKNWRKDISDAFNDSRFFASDLARAEKDWLPLLRQWINTDKDRMTELLSRITPPTTAGIVFGVGATSARLEADRRTQLNLRRIATLILASSEDAFVSDLESIAAKLTELLTASARSSPSSATRAEIYMVLRALVLRTSAINLAMLWPVVNSELHAALASIVAVEGTSAYETYPVPAILQACKLLDVLLCVAPDDFQLHQWLFVTDTIDAVYRPESYHPVALADELSEELGQTASKSISAPGIESVVHLLAGGPHKRPLIGESGDSVERRDELVVHVLQPFFSQLSIFAFESTYSMGTLDKEFCVYGLLKDLFDERTIVKGL
ncbi:Protein dopey [Ceratocystis fimbriata CBS 114723]|uniref:Protein dopey n=1 Tax=Ceratocystis fimbriata CBS 114723 TaxID=1035309 RepID=A0A2C5X636_9PEZI|nr:Protein dopey [Ceratocystis fimbriata CBS 114723]